MLFFKDSPGGKSDGRQFLLIMLLIVITVFAFSRLRDANLLYFDDNTLFSELTFENLPSNPVQNIFSSPYLFGSYYRPLTSLALYLETNFAPDPVSFAHRANLILHILTVILLFSTLGRFGFSAGLSFFAAAFYALAPIQTNALGWIAGRADLLGGLITISMLWILSRVQTENKYRSAVVLLFLMSAGVLCKENMLMLPCLLLCFGAWSIVRYSEKYWIPAMISAVLVLVSYGLLRFLLNGQNAPQPLLIQNVVYNFHQIPETVGKLVAVWQITPLPDNDPVAGAIGWIIIGLIIFAGYRIKGERMKIWGGLAFFILLMLPGLFTRTLVFDSHHYWDCRSYAPLLGLVISLTAIAQSLKHSIYLKSLECIVITLLGVYTFHLSGFYTDGAVFWSEFKKEFPSQPAGYAGLTIYNLETGNAGLARQDAISAMRTFPNNFALLKSLAPALEQKYDFSTAAYLYSGFLEKNGTHNELAIDLVRDYALLGDSSGFYNTLVQYKVDSNAVLTMLQGNKDYYRKLNKPALVQNLEKVKL